MSRRSDFFIAGAAAGLVVGFVAGLLLAPVSGAIARKRIADEAAYTIERARTLAAQAENIAEVVGRRMEHFLGREEEVAWEKIRELREGLSRFQVER